MRSKKALVLGTLSAAVAAAVLGPGAGTAFAAYTAGVQNGTLNVVGDNAADRLALRLAVGDPNTLQVDVGDDGTADFSFDRSTFTAIHVAAGGGDDQVRIDQIGGTFTDEAVTIDGGNGNDTLLGGDGADTLIGGAGKDFVDGNRGTTPRCSGPATTRSSGIPVTEATPSRGRAAATASPSTARTRARSWRCAGTARVCSSRVTSPRSRWT